jgi:flagellar biosynthesis protein FlhF
LNHTTQVMTTHKVVAPSSREAFRLLRERLGPNAIVLSNRVTANGVEILASTEAPLTKLIAPPPVITVPDVFLPAMQPLPEPTGISNGDSVLREIHSMRGMIEEQLAGMAWNEKQRRDPVRGHLLRTLLGAGFSARLAKDILEDLPTGQSYAHGMSYVKGELARQIPVLDNEDALMDGGGVYALTGPTGVGKTTTTAKLAARCVMRFGAEKLALVTTDSFRIGAYEQLRIYGQILGVSVHAVKDAADLALVLSELRDKHMVLIDTVGMSQRDRSVSDQIAMLSGAGRPVKRLLLLNASSHGDTLNEVVQAYRHGENPAASADLAGCIFTKVDEATHPGALIDMAIRHQLPVHYIASGQKVPEHLMLVDRATLVDSVFQANSRSSLFVAGEAGLDERLMPLDKEVEVAAAEAVSQRLRSQCQQLIRALTHNAQELAFNASSLANGQIGFEETRALWHKLSDCQTDAKTIAASLVLQAAAEALSSCDDYVLAVHGEIALASDQGLEPRVLNSTLLLSDRSGSAIAAPSHFLESIGRAGIREDSSRQNFGKSEVYLLARMPASTLMDEWQASGRQWAAGSPGTLRVADAKSGMPRTLARIASGLSFGEPAPVTYRRKNAFMSVAEVLVSVRSDLKDVDTPTETQATVLRCVVKRIVDAASGKAVSHSYVLTSTGIRATALQVAQWPAWRAAAEPYFKLLKQAIAQVGSVDSMDDAQLLKRLLVAGQASSTVFRLSCKQDAWADTARKALAQLAGRPSRPDRPVPGPALFEGLGKLFVLLDAMQTDDMAVSPSTHVATA